MLLSAALCVPMLLSAIELKAMLLSAELLKFTFEIGAPAGLPDPVTTEIGMSPIGTCASPAPTRVRSTLNPTLPNTGPEGVSVGVGVNVAVGVDVAVAVKVGVGVAVAVAVFVGDGVDVGVAVDVAVFVGHGSPATCGIGSSEYGAS
ncbi:MAG: hypothetical protein ACYDCT_10915 [Dehalococcoidia bacterium]